MLAYTYPLLDVFLTILYIAGFVIWIWLLFIVFADIFRSRDMSGWAKALWVVGVLILPLIGVLLYLIVRGSSMSQRAVADAQAREQANRQYIRSAAGNGRTSTADELAKLSALRDSGAISQAEFDREKAKVLSHSA